MKRRAILAGRIATAWFGLTPREQQALVLVLAVFLLGVAVRFGCVCFGNGP